MNPNPPPNPLPLIPRGLSDEEFDKWVRADPRHLAAMEALAELVVASKPGQADPELRAQSEGLLANRSERAVLGIVEAKLQALTAVLRRPPGTMVASDRIAQANQIMDELTDALLDTPEPHRTKHLKAMLPLREQVRAFKLGA